MDPNLGQQFSKDIVKEEIMDPEEGQMRLPAERDDLRPVKEETSNCPMIKEEVEDDETWRYGGWSTKKKADSGENSVARRTLNPAIEDNNYITQQGLNAEIKEEAEPFPVVIGQAVPPTSSQAGGSLPFPKLEAFNAHSVFTNEVTGKEELNEDGEEEAAGCSVIKGEVEDEEMWRRYGGFPTKKKADSGENPEAKRRKWTPACEDYTTQQGLNAEVKEEAKEQGGMDRTADDNVEKKCITCDYRAGSDELVLMHIQEVHNNKKSFECTKCGKILSRKDTLNNHMASVHEGIKKYPCKECNHKSAQKADLDKHKK